MAALFFPERTTPGASQGLAASVIAIREASRIRREKLCPSKGLVRLYCPEHPETIRSVRNSAIRLSLSSYRMA